MASANRNNVHLSRIQKRKNNIKDYYTKKKDEKLYVTLNTKRNFWKIHDYGFRSISLAILVYFAIQTSLRAICIQITLFFSCEAPRIALRTPGDAQGTRVKRIHNSSLIFPHLSRAPLSNSTSSLSLSFCCRAVFPFSFHASKVAKKIKEKRVKKGREKERVLSECKGRMRDSPDAKGIYTPSTLRAVKTFNVLGGSLLCSFYPEKARREREQNQKNAGTRLSYVPSISEHPKY